MKILSPASRHILLLLEQDYLLFVEQVNGNTLSSLLLRGLVSLKRKVLHITPLGSSTLEWDRARRFESWREMQAVVRNLKGKK